MNIMSITWNAIDIDVYWNLTEKCYLTNYLTRIGCDKYANIDKRNNSKGWDFTPFQATNSLFYMNWK